MATRLAVPWICPSCRSLNAIRTSIAARRIGLQNSDRNQRRYKWNIASAGQQASPHVGFYADILAHPIYTTNLTTSPSREAKPATPLTVEEEMLSEREKTLKKAAIVFGSRLAGPAERHEETRKKSKLIAGVLVPPRPSEPDNCCMSGCVNCVWDVYREDLEEWAAKNAEARASLQALQSRGEATGTMAADPGTPTHVATSMDDDGGGRETNWTSAAPGTSADLFSDIPVGIREFMRTEKMLKQKHMSEASNSS